VDKIKELTASEAWSRAIDSLKDELTPHVYERWLRPIQAVSLNESEILLGVPDEFFKTWVVDHYGSMISIALKDITGDADFTGAEPPLLSDFEQVLSGMEGSASLVERLSKYTRGTWAGFLNQPTNIDINQQFAVFSVRDMEDELKPVAMYILTHYIWNAVRHEMKKRLLIIDEAWWMMKSDDTASFLYSLAKRGRKYYLGVCTITQDVEDFLKSPYGRPILTNSSLQLLLKQSSTTIDVLQQTFNLTDEEKYLLLEAGVGEGLFFAGLKHVAIKVVASYTEDQIITSDPSQLLAIKKEKERYAAEKK